jgi:hypothetical protein
MASLQIASLMYFKGFYDHGCFPLFLKFGRVAPVFIHQKELDELGMMLQGVCAVSSPSQLDVEVSDSWPLLLTLPDLPGHVNDQSMG